MSKRRIFTTNPRDRLRVITRTDTGIRVRYIPVPAKRDPDRWVGFGLAVAGIFVVAFLLAESFGFVSSSDSRRPDAAAAGTDCRQSEGYTK